MPRLQRMWSDCSKYPLERPLAGTAIYVWSEEGKFLGKGIAGTRRAYGGVITVAGKTYNSNHVLHWLPQSAVNKAMIEHMPR